MGSTLIYNGQIVIFQVIGCIVLEKKIFSMRLHIIFGFDWLSGFKVEDVYK